MPVVPMQNILARAFEQRYGVAGFNIVDALTMEAVLAAAQQTGSPVIIQASVKTVKMLGARLIQAMFSELAGRVSIPTALHLDHCSDLAVISGCLAAGWNSVLFDGSGLSYEENLEQTTRVVAMARQYGAAVEGELEAVRSVKDDAKGEGESQLVPLEKALEFIRGTGIDSFAPAVGTAHGLYRHEPKIDFERISAIVDAEPIPIVLHGGTGLSDKVFRECIGRGAVKINISTQLKITFADALRRYLNDHPTEYDPLRLLSATRDQVTDMASRFMDIFGSRGKAQ